MNKLLQFSLDLYYLILALPIAYTLFLVIDLVTLNGLRENPPYGDIKENYKKILSYYFGE
jgi:hypothetical protein